MSLNWYNNTSSKIRVKCWFYLHCISSNRGAYLEGYSLAKLKSRSKVAPKKIRVGKLNMEFASCPQWKMNNVRSACHNLQNAGDANSLHRLKVVVKWNIFYFTPAFQKALMWRAGRPVYFGPHTNFYMHYSNSGVCLHFTLSWCYLIHQN
jgi:hypothetical protein